MSPIEKLIPNVLPIHLIALHFIVDSTRRIDIAVSSSDITPVERHERLNADALCT